MQKRYEEIERELDRLGVQYEMEKTSKHTKLHLFHAGKKRMVILSTSTSDHRANKNRIRDIRRTLSDMGMQAHG